MFLIFSMLIGCAFFAFISFFLGLWLKRHPSPRAARITARFVHSAAAIAVLLPAAGGAAQMAQLDGVLGLPSFSLGPVTGALGFIMTAGGLTLGFVSVIVLLERGEGLPLLQLTRKLAAQSVYRRTRNPMSLGFYMMCIGAGVLGKSTFFTLWSILALIPAHMVFLKCFEERELEIRLGGQYKEYKKNTPFLIPKRRGRH